MLPPPPLPVCARGEGGCCCWMSGDLEGLSLRPNRLLKEGRGSSSLAITTTCAGWRACRWAGGQADSSRWCQMLACLRLPAVHAVRQDCTAKVVRHGLFTAGPPCSSAHWVAHDTELHTPLQSCKLTCLKLHCGTTGSDGYHPGKNETNPEGRPQFSSIMRRFPLPPALPPPYPPSPPGPSQLTQSPH